MRSRAYTGGRTLVMSLIVALALAGCGGGGGGGGNGDPGPGPGPGPTPQPTLSFTPESVPATTDLLALALNTSESSGSTVVLDVMVNSVATGAVSGLSADIRFDATKMTYQGFEADGAGVGVALASPLENDPSVVILGVHAVKASTGRLGKLRFTLNSGTVSGQLTMLSTEYIGAGGSPVASPKLSGRGGTVTLS